jgi:hypothetical protein
MAFLQIDEERLRFLASRGIPDGPGLRTLVWRILLTYLPLDRTRWEVRPIANSVASHAARTFCWDRIMSSPGSILWCVWQSHLASQRGLYRQFVNDLTSKPDHGDTEDAGKRVTVSPTRRYDSLSLSASRSICASRGTRVRGSRHGRPS